ncbi:MAG TPA: TRAM domain-containing protein [Gemmatimonadales bacterium]|nr:TRAM domain-containing protein [Gemmatimonadales bacterium]
MTAARILRIAAGGDGVGRLEDGRAVFVPRSAPGDLVELTGLRSQRRFARARVARVLEPGPDRIEPPCPHYVDDECGGCQLQHLATGAQREARRSIVGDALRRLARLDVADPEIVPADQELEYRTKITLHADARAGTIGLHPYGRAEQVFELRRCLITVAELNRLWSALRMLREHFPPRLETLMLRLDRHGDCHAVFESARGSRWSEAGALREALLAEGIEGTIWWREPGGEPRSVAGRGEPFPATVFEQVHPAMGDRVRAFAVDALGPAADRVVWDLYAGIGETTAALAEAGARVESVEWDERAVAEAEARGPSARRVAGRVEDVLGRLETPSLVVTNPPRVGMDPRVPAELERRRPERIVYISCDPATLARDLARLTSYRIGVLRAFDLFPQTAHVETVAVLERAS